MMTCVSCGPTASAPSPTLNKMCTRCWWNLPAATRSAYQHGQIGIKQITRASRDSQRSVRAFGGGNRGHRVVVVLIALLTVYTAGGCVDREQPATTTTVAATAAPAGVLPARDEEFERRFAEAYERAARMRKGAGAAVPTTTASDTGQPLRRAPVHVVRFDSPALPTPILDERQRGCIGYPLTAGFSRVRYNLLLQPNVYVVAKPLWSDPQWLATFRVDGGTFPVNLWRVRAGVPTFWKVVRVQAGPGLPTGNPQEGLSAEFFRGGDVLCVEATRSGGPLFVAYDQQTGLVVQPQLSVVENSSNDSTPMPGVWMVISGEGTQ